MTDDVGVRLAVDKAEAGVSPPVAPPSQYAGPLLLGAPFNSPIRVVAVRRNCDSYRLDLIEHADKVAALLLRISCEGYRYQL
uniref:hypothetical protein n=1 Tax=Rhodococcus sp. O3 TaxID=3404919 RepID=UPI003B67F8E0